MNSKDRKLWRKLPDKLKEVLAGLPAPVDIESFKVFGQNWNAQILCSGRLFEFSSDMRDFGYISVSEIIRSANRPVFRKIMPPENQRIQITAAQVCDLMQREFAGLNNAANGEA
jgi:hypothetical protein